MRGRVTTATGGLPLPGVQIAITGAATLGATTDLLGRFEFPSVPPGSVTISASLAGYQLASGNATLAGGVTLDFSPTLYTDNETAPTTGRFIGRVVVAGTGAALPGVAIVLNGAAAGTSAADGSFDLTLAPQTYVALYTLAGYDGASQGFVLAAGTTVDAGTVALPAQRTATTITGRVTDTQGTPLPDATVQVLGGASATTGADGVFTLSNLAGLSFDLRASATGYASQLVTLQVSRPSDVAHSFALVSGSTSLSIGDLQVSPASPGANAQVTVATSITNIGVTEASALLLVQVVDVDGAGGAAGAVIGVGIPQDVNGNLLGMVHLAADTVQQVRVLWNTGRFAPGRYLLVLRLVSPESVTMATPQGSLLLEKAATVDVTASRHFAGSVTANPPVLRAGTNTPIKLSALLQNDGNIALPPQAYTLKVVNTQTSAVAHTQAVNVQALAVAELGEVPFSDWTPAAGGNFRVEITSADPAEGKVTTSLFVGDAGTALYTTNKLVVPAGTQTVRAKVRITGQDVAGGTISDPLAAPIRAAIQKAVTYADDFGSSHYVNDLKCYGCHLQTQSVLGGELNRHLATFDANKRRTLVNGITQFQKAGGDWHGDGFKVSTMLALWALNGWRDPDQFAWTKSRAADYLLATQEGNGAWSSDHTHTAWWRTTASVTGLVAKAFADLRKYLAKQPAPTVPRYTPVTWARGAAVTGQFIALHEAPDAKLYVSRFNEKRVDILRDDGTLQLVHSGLSVRDSLVTADGTLYMSAEEGVYRRSPDGTLAQLTNKPAAGIARGPDGTLYFGAWSEPALYKIDPGGALTRLAPSAPLAKADRHRARRRRLAHRRRLLNEFHLPRAPGWHVHATHRAIQRAVQNPALG